MASTVTVMGIGRPGKRSVLPVAGLSQIKGPLSMLGMALGYLGLVAILSMAPFWASGHHAASELGNGVYGLRRQPLKRRGADCLFHPNCLK